MMAIKSLWKWGLIGAALAAAPARSDISWSGQRDVWVAFNEFNPGYILDLDLNEDSTTDFIIQWDLPDLFNLVVKPQLGLDGHINGVTSEKKGIIYENWPLLSDVLIEPMLTDGQQWLNETETLIEWMWGSAGAQGVGPWGEPYGPIDHMYMGLQFDAADGIHYGWVEMSTSITAYEATVHSWAYNTTPGESILTGAVPEPSTALLAVIGGMSVWVLRRQNRASKPWKE